jgi:hypothetical protein
MHQFKRWREERRKPKETDLYKPLLHDFDLFTPWAEPGHVWPGKQKLHTYASGRPDDEHGGMTAGEGGEGGEGGEDESVDEDEDLMAEVVAAEDDDDDNSDGEDEVEKILGSAAESREDGSGARSRRKAQARSLHTGQDG